MRKTWLATLALVVVVSCGVPGSPPGATRVAGVPPRGGAGSGAKPSRYVKHQLFLNGYEITEGRTLNLPGNCRWLVMKHLEEGKFAPGEGEEGEICLILSERRTPTSGFWPVMSFLTEKEAVHLADELNTAARRSLAGGTSDRQE